MINQDPTVINQADEAHRSQYDFIDGFARHLHDALPNASFIGFTGTPIETGDRSTPAVFGDYIDKYDILRAVQDGATVPIYYESRLAKIELLESEKPKIDPQFEEITEDAEEYDKQKLQSKWARLEALVGAENRIQKIAGDILQHFDQRLNTMDGKGLIVCMSRRICIEMYNAIIKQKPHWHNSDDNQGAVKIIMTGTITDDPAWRSHIHGKTEREALAKRLQGIAAAIDHIVALENGKKRFLAAVTNLSKAFALSVPHENALKIRDQVGLFQEIRSGIAKITAEGSERTPEEMDTAIRRYQNRTIESAVVIEEMIDIARKMNEARRRGEETGLSEDEIAFYEALEVNDSAVKVLGDKILKTIAQELVATIRKNVSIDWTVRESVRASIRKDVKRLLRKYGYPPDKQEKATDTVLEQAEALCKDWTGEE